MIYGANGKPAIQEKSALEPLMPYLWQEMTDRYLDYLDLMGAIQGYVLDEYGRYVKSGEPGDRVKIKMEYKLP